MRHRDFGLVFDKTWACQLKYNKRPDLHFLKLTTGKHNAIGKSILCMLGTCGESRAIWGSASLSTDEQGRLENETQHEEAMKKSFRDDTSKQTDEQTRRSNSRIQLSTTFGCRKGVHQLLTWTSKSQHRESAQEVWRTRRSAEKKAYRCVRHSYSVVRKINSCTLLTSSKLRLSMFPPWPRRRQQQRWKGRQQEKKKQPDGYFSYATGWEIQFRYLLSLYLI